MDLREFEQQLQLNLRAYDIDRRTEIADICYGLRMDEASLRHYYELWQNFAKAIKDLEDKIMATDVLASTIASEYKISTKIAKLVVRHIVLNVNQLYPKQVEPISIKRKQNPNRWKLPTTSQTDPKNN
jgi:hypothetical protein